MVGMNATDEKGGVIPIRAIEARKAAGITDYEREYDELQKKMEERGHKKHAQLRVPVRDVTALPRIAEILHGLASDITAIHSATDLSEYSKLFEVIVKVGAAERRLKESKHRR